MILFVGDKPSRLNKDPNIPFKGAACEKRLMEWIKILGVKDYDIVNTTDTRFDVLVQFSTYNGFPIIALGNNADKALKRYGCFKLPHPSGRNRQVNNKKFIKTKLEECKRYINYVQSRG